MDNSGNMPEGVETITRVTISGARGTGRCDTCHGYTGMEIGPQHRDHRFNRDLLCSCVEWDLRSDYDRGRADERERITAWLSTRPGDRGGTVVMSVGHALAERIKRGDHVS